MGIMTRMLRLWKADVHGVMDQLEDKGLLLKQYLREMESSLGHKERQVSALARRSEQIERQVVRHIEEMDKLERDLTLALQKGKDDIARMLIRRRRALEAASDHLKEQTETIAHEKTQLSQTLADQRLQYETLKTKTEIFCSRGGEHHFEAATGHGSNWTPVETNDEEIELELLQRKEALHKGGTP